MARKEIRILFVLKLDTVMLANRYQKFGDNGRNGKLYKCSPNCWESEDGIKRQVSRKNMGVHSQMPVDRVNREVMETIITEKGDVLDILGISSTVLATLVGSGVV